MSAKFATHYNIYVAGRPNIKPSDILAMKSNYKGCAPYKPASSTAPSSPAAMMMATVEHTTVHAQNSINNLSKNVPSATTTVHSNNCNNSNNYALANNASAASVDVRNNQPQPKSTKSNNQSSSRKNGRIGRQESRYTSACSHRPHGLLLVGEIVKKIKKCKDYYEILGVTKESTDSEIKKAYKKLALQLHPDKNKAPGAAEAFKAVGNAVATLTDAEKRKAYDLYGADEANNGMRRQNHHRHHGTGFAYTQGFESDVTAEELFNMFFGGGFPQQQNVFMRQRRFHRAEQQQARGEAQSGYSALINLLPILLLISLSMMSSFFISDPIYSLQPSHKYSIERKTNTYKISYYVKDNFHSEYQGSLGRLEASVEEEYINNLKHACYREKNYKESMFIRARSFGDREIYRKAQAVATPSCDQLQKMQNI